MVRILVYARNVAVFKGKYMGILKVLWEQNRFKFYGTAEKFRNHYIFKELLNTCYSKEWAPYCKTTFSDACTAKKICQNSSLRSTV